MWTYWFDLGEGVVPLSIFSYFTHTQCTHHQHMTLHLIDTMR